MTDITGWSPDPHDSFFADTHSTSIVKSTLESGPIWNQRVHVVLKMASYNKCVFMCLLSVAGVNFAPWPSSPSQTCSFTPRSTQKQRPTSVLTAPRPLPTHRIWPSISAYTSVWNHITAPTVRNVFASSPIYSSTPGLTFIYTHCSSFYQNL